jgi:asparagine synthase (glutamine-hydrolysing)
MCGIAGYVDFNDPKPLPDVLASMLDRLGHRGPDANGAAINGPCGLAHTRLSITDILGSGGAQPMHSPDGVSIVFAGAIYNHLDLRSSLEQSGERFASRSDTEVLLRSVARHWQRSLSSLDGMFAFAAWRQDQRRLLLARDPFGQKPLFYAVPRPGLLVFGSEIKAVQSHPLVDRQLDDQGLRSSLRFRGCYGERTLYSMVRQVSPGHFLEFSERGLRDGRYFDLVGDVEAARAHIIGLSRSDVSEIGRDLFDASVRKCMSGDVPVGAFLSGGIDSSMVVASLGKSTAPDVPLHTFSVEFEHAGSDDATFARQVADKVGTVQHATTIGPECFERRWAELSWSRDSPLGEPAEVAFAELSRLARQQVKVVLTGDGGDELQAGYPKYRHASLAALIRPLARMFSPRFVNSAGGLLGFASRRAQIAFWALSRASETDSHLQWFSLSQAQLQAVLPGLDWSDRTWLQDINDAIGLTQSNERESGITRMQILDCATWLPGNMLPQAERMSMAEGLELRSPFLDSRLASYLLAMPDDMKIRHGQQKWALRSWARDRLPLEIARRRKWGIKPPFGTWLRGPLRSMLNDYLSSNHGLCAQFADRAALSALIERHQRGWVDATNVLWTLLSAEVWYQHRDMGQTRAQLPMSETIGSVFAEALQP